MKRRWAPMDMPHCRGQLTGPHAELVHACSDTLRRYCESLWYSGLEYIRPSDEEIFAKCGILFTKRQIPSDILFAFFYQMDNLFSMSKVIHTIRSIMDWLDASENRATQETSIYDMHLQIPNFIEALSDHLKALRLCEELLRHLGSVYHRVRPESGFQRFSARAIVDYSTEQNTTKIRANQWYRVQNNSNPHIWKLRDPVQKVPSLFLEASTECGEELMLRRLRERFDEFLIMCHGRSRRQLFSRITRHLQKDGKYATLPNMRLSEPHGPSSPMEGLYFARSPNPSKRWRSFFNPKIVGRQPSYYSFTTPEEFYCPETVRRMLTELRRWVHDLPPPTALMNGTDDSRLSLTRKKSLDTEDRWQDDDTVDHLQRWWSMAYPLVPDQTQLDRIVSEACFLKNFNDILRSRVNLKLERSLSEKQFQRSQTTQR
ncbi:hypothetical protein FBUS_04656 [Fasciolopsis buskii]|uniref:Uncharacterized protein n=1 Tax=Fasciolopsis buskii TaxID=27845 RepID=A0A8E0VKF4_9TREM|nr:hypothetical protein FBUS_04656 [Fasciolopsis buski]